MLQCFSHIWTFSSLIIIIQHYICCSTFKDGMNLKGDENIQEFEENRFNNKVKEKYCEDLTLDWFNALWVKPCCNWEIKEL